MNNTARIEIEYINHKYRVLRGEVEEASLVDVELMLTSLNTIVTELHSMYYVWELKERENTLYVIQPKLTKVFYGETGMPETLEWEDFSSTRHHMYKIPSYSDTGVSFYYKSLCYWIKDTMDDLIKNYV